MLLTILATLSSCSKNDTRTDSVKDTDQSSLDNSDITTGKMSETTIFSNESTLKWGDQFVNKLKKMGVSPQHAFTSANLLDGVLNVRNIKVGSTVQVLSSDSGLVRMVLTPPRSQYSYRVERVDSDNFSVTTDTLNIERHLVRREGVIVSNFYNSFLRNGGNAELAVKYIEVFQFVLYFSSETQEGDEYRLIVEELRCDGEVIGYGRILAAQYVNQFGTLTGIWRPDTTSEFGGDYFNEEGISLRRDLLRAPFSAARVTSTYGLRKHPISGNIKMHRGIDFGAKTGTPVVASGSGTVTRAVRGSPSLGNWVEIRHGKTGFVTRYGHFRAIAKGVRQGGFVKQGQIIGYVGMTGYATGPHLHYETIRDGKHVNPMRVKGSPVRKLKPDELNPFLSDRFFLWKQRLEQPDIVDNQEGISGPQPAVARIESPVE